MNGLKFPRLYIYLTYAHVLSDSPYFAFSKYAYIYIYIYARVYMRVHEFTLFDKIVQFETRNRKGKTNDKSAIQNTIFLYRQSKYS